MANNLSVPREAELRCDLALPTKIKEGDRTRKFHLTDKQGNICSAYLAADLFNLFSVPTVFAQRLEDQFNDELPKIVASIKEWAREWQEDIAGWELYPCDSVTKNYIRFRFVVVQKGTEYNKVLAESLSQFSVHLYNDMGCSLIRVAALMVPDVSEEEIANIFA